MKTSGLFVLVFTAALGGGAWAQGQVPAQKPPAAAQAPAATQPPAGQPPAAQPPGTSKPAAPKPRPSTPSARLSLTVFVTDPTGAPQAGIKVNADGPIVREGVTSREGSVTFQGLRAGQYRLRFTAERFIPFEKEVTVKGGAVEEIEVSLTRAPAAPAPAEPPPAAKSAPTAAAVPPPDPSASVEIMSVVDWLAKNKLERGEPRKEGIIARTPLQSSALLQVRDSLRDRSHADADEVIYVINGAAVISTKGRQQSIETGALVIIPRGVAVTIENRGREPLWALSVLTPPAVPKP